MKITGTGRILRIYIDETDSWHGKPLYRAIVEKAREMDLAGATVLRGIEGFGANSRIHTATLLRLSEGLPIVVEIVDKPERLETIIPELDKMVAEGLITLETVEVVKYEHQQPSPR